MADAFDDYALSLTPWMYLRLSDTSGTSAVDASGNSQTGTYVNTPTLNQPPISFDQTGRSVLFNGANQYITVPHHANFDATEFTVIALVKLTSLASYASIIHHGDFTVGGSQGYSIYFQISTGKLVFYTYYSGDWRTGTTTNSIITTNRTFFIAVNYTNSYIYFYRNGELFEQLAWSFGGKGTSTQSVKIGVAKDSSYTWYLPGFMSRFLFFNSSLTAEQIKTLYNTMIVSYRGAPLEVGKPLTQQQFTKWGH